ncbi:MAG: hypothetical protein ACLTYN_11650 [Dysosmobacter welbionis]
MSADYLNVVRTMSSPYGRVNSDGVNVRSTPLPTALCWPPLRGRHRHGQRLGGRLVRRHLWYGTEGYIRRLPGPDESSSSTATSRPPPSLPERVMCGGASPA